MLFVFGIPFQGLRIPSELAPQEDRAMIRIFVTAPEGSSITYLDRQLRQVEEIAMAEVENGNARRVNVRTGGFGRSGDVSTGMIMIPLNLWGERDESAGAIADRLRQQTQGITGARINVNQVGSPLTRNSTRPLAIAMGGGDYDEIVRWRDKIMQRVAAENPSILNLESDYLERQPRVIVQIDRNKAADLGVSLQTVGRTLETMLGARIVTTFERAGEEYDVMLQARERRSAPASATSTISTCDPTRTATCCRCPRWSRSTNARVPPNCAARTACAPSNSRAHSRRGTRWVKP